MSQKTDGKKVWQCVENRKDATVAFRVWWGAEKEPKTFPLYIGGAAKRTHPTERTE